MTRDELATALTDADGEIRLAAIREVTENPAEPLADSALDALLQCLAARRKVFQRRAAEALATYAVHDGRVVENLRAMLSHHDQRARWGAAYALGRVASEDALDLRALPILFEALASNDGDVRWAAAELVVRLGKQHRDAVSGAVIQLARGGNLNARKMALYCLRDVGGPREDLLAVAETCSTDHSSLLKMATLSLIPRIADGGARSAAVALRLLENDPDAGVRRCAAVALGHIGHRDRHVIEALTRAMRLEGDVYMKRAAEGALNRLDEHHD